MKIKADVIDYQSIINCEFDYLEKFFRNETWLKIMINLSVRVKMKGDSWRKWIAIQFLIIAIR